MINCYLVPRAQEMRNKNNKCSILLFVTPDPHSNALSSPKPHYHKTTTPPSSSSIIINTPPPSYQNMPLQHAVLYHAFPEITNFTCNNGDDWGKFCTNTAHTTRKAKKAPSLSKQPSKHKIAKNKGLFAPEPLLQENPHCFVLFPIHHADIWRMYKKAKGFFLDGGRDQLLGRPRGLNQAVQHQMPLHLPCPCILCCLQ